MLGAQREDDNEADLGRAPGRGGVSIGDPPRLGQPDREIQGSQQTLRWREMDSNFRFPNAPSGRSAEARMFSSDREFGPLAWRDRDFEPPVPWQGGSLR